MMAGYPGHWWIAGGWAIEAFTGVPRPHGDLDLSIPRTELPLFRRYLAGRIDLWAADQETLRILLPGDIGEDDLPDSCENVWARDGGGNPWEYDTILMSTSLISTGADIWVYKRDPRVRRPIDEILWSRDKINYLRPEIQLLHKARGLRTKDQRDFDVALPLLSVQDQRWLRDALALTVPGHPWIDRL
ncbi:hypothetical protein FOE78_16405 [Microlunatus elymi]|uniref:Aminoglycoside-2''-adenylyltransferase n=1 Tax=Microlunatus elymi TaxID=2596828 RepID=A0A516Q5Y4_9ACTN|nr:hypothetical protein FOE78_16405 [Microlunatus elymi]